MRRSLRQTKVSSACLYVFLSVCPLAYVTNHIHISPNVVYMLPLTMARSFSDGSAICYGLPFLWMTSYF